MLSQSGDERNFDEEEFILVGSFQDDESKFNLRGDEDGNSARMKIMSSSQCIVFDRSMIHDSGLLIQSSP